MMFRARCLVLSSLLLLGAASGAIAGEESLSAYARLVKAADPVAYWSFDEQANSAKDWQQITFGTYEGTVKPHGKFERTEGPNGLDSLILSDANHALATTGGTGRLMLTDSGEESELDFKTGDTITLEAWVKPRSIRDGQQVYIVGKGRTYADGKRRENQNYALRLRGIGSQAHPSFLFRGIREDGDQEYFRWNANLGVPVDGEWHHIAVIYAFGRHADPIAFVDGLRTGGRWDLGRRTTAKPVVDDGQLWIGSAMGGNYSSTFQGELDEVAIYRRALKPSEIRRRTLTRPTPPPLAIDAAPSDRVRVSVYENVPDAKKWPVRYTSPSEEYSLPAFAMTKLPRKYGSQGIPVDWANPTVLRMESRIDFPAGRHRLLVRAKNGARLFVDGRPVADLPFHNTSSSAHGEIKENAHVVAKDLRQLQTGDREAVAVVDLEAGRHEITFDLFIGGTGKRLEPGEVVIASQLVDKTVDAKTTLSDDVFTLLTPSEAWRLPLTEDGWDRIADRMFENRRERNAERRRGSDPEEKAFWERRHELARQTIEQRGRLDVPTLPPGMTANNHIDHFIAAKIAEHNAEAEQPVTPTPLTSDEAFLRRVTLDVLGTIPTPRQIAAFQQDTAPDRRARYIDRLLEHPAWADHWTAYWQDVLAENPNLVNPTLGNTGPFRWWIHESLLDNKPMDRFATELVSMNGSHWLGGPGAFAMASGNDAPMAAKAHVISQAFLGVDLKCARCHDAPFNDLKQRDLFNLAAMLARKPRSVPKSSTVPLDPDGTTSFLIEITLKPGEPVPPAWPFEELVDAGLVRELSRKPGDTREELAAIITSPENRRFAGVIVNRVWRRYLGQAFVEPVDAWGSMDPSHPDLLEDLTDEFIAHGYDLKHLARLILNSQTYQRKPTDVLPGIGEEYLFHAPIRRRMTAEQVIDSLFLAAGKRFRAGELNIDQAGARKRKQSLNLGRPRRAWQFASTANERDRPSLSLPHAEPFVDVLETFGWRPTRQDPLTVRESEPTVLQPAILSNGVLARRFLTLSEDSAFTTLALREQPVEKLVDQVVLRVLSRPATAREREVFTALLTEGYADRIVPDAKPAPLFRDRSTGVSWSNHLSERANTEQIALGQEVKQGDPPTTRLTPAWRTRMEDMLWALLNTPEFLFLP